MRFSIIIILIIYAAITTSESNYYKNQAEKLLTEAIVDAEETDDALDKCVEIAIKTIELKKELEECRDKH